MRLLSLCTVRWLHFVIRVMKGQSQHITRDEPLQAAVGNLISFHLLPIIGQNVSTSKGRVLAKGTFTGVGSAAGPQTQICARKILGADLIPQTRCGF